jgi:hypothetical protein
MDPAENLKPANVDWKHMTRRKYPSVLNDWKAKHVGDM